MSCVSCGHNDWVTIGQSKYCTHCGDPATGAAGDNNPAPTVSAAVNSTIQPVELPSTRSLSDLKTATTESTISQPNPAHSYHSRITTPAGALDLRTASPGVKGGDTRRLDVKAPKPAIITATNKADRVSRAVSIPTSPAISRFKRGPKPAAPTEIAQPQAIQTEPTPPLPATAIPGSPIIDPAVTQQIYNELPNQVVSQIRSMQSLIPPTQPAEQKPKPRKEKQPKPHRAMSIAAAGMSAAVMAGYIWLNNYDSLTIKAAAGKAGIQATAPSYLPASYSLAGPISFGNGFVSMKYKSPASSDLITLNQRKSDWTAASLLELYVNKQAKTYLSVQTQGLTIYLLDNGQATWVNRGIQYVLQGNTMLSHDQLIKMAESL